MTIPDVFSPIGGIVSGGASGVLTTVGLFRQKLSVVKEKQRQLEAQQKQNHKLQVATLEIVSNIAKHMNLDRREYSDVLVRALTTIEDD